MSSFVNGHTLESNESISAIMHIDPQDNPIIGEEASLQFEFIDPKQAFTLEMCECIISINLKNNNLLTQALVSDTNNVHTSTVSFSFPEKAIYTVKIQGKPQHGEIFKPFTLTYSLRVERNNKSGIVSDLFEHHVIHFSVVIFWFCLFILYNLFQHYKDKEK